METPYLRNVPADVAADRADLAAREGMPVNAFAVRNWRASRGAPLTH